LEKNPTPCDISSSPCCLGWAEHSKFWYPDWSPPGQRSRWCSLMSWRLIKRQEMAP